MALEYTLVVTDDVDPATVANLFSKDVLVEQASHGMVFTANLGLLLAIVYRATQADNAATLREFGVPASVMIVFRFDSQDDTLARKIMIRSLATFLEFHAGAVSVFHEDDLLLARSDTRQVSKRLMWTDENQAAFPGWDVVA